MKRIVAISLSIIFLLCACSSQPRLYDSNLLVAKRIITAVDKFLDGEMSTQDLYDILEEEKNYIDKEDDRDLVAAEALYYSTLSIKFHLRNPNTGLTNLDNLKDSRNMIAELAGVK